MPFDRTTAWTADFTGVIVAALTPFAANGIDLDAVPGYVDFLVDGGAAGVMVAGTTGEFLAMDDSEREVALEAFVTSVGGRIPVIAHIGHIDHRRSRRLARHAVRAGADAVAGITPYYYPTTPRAIERFMSDLARSVPQLPFLVYNFPRASGNALGFELFERLLEEPNVTGTKLSVATFNEIEPYLALPDDICVISGNDSLLPQFLTRRGRAVVSGNAAAFPELISHAFTKLASSVATSERHSIEQLLDDVTAVTRGGAPDRLKDVLRRRGHDLGQARIRTYEPEEILPDVAVRIERLLGLAAHAPSQAQGDVWN